MLPARQAKEALGWAAGIQIIQADAQLLVQFSIKCLLNSAAHWPPRWSPPLQRRDDTPAVGVCAAEVEVLLTALHWWFWDKLADPTYCLDHDSIHDSARWEELGWPGHPIERTPHPRLSPDFNRPAEHFIAATKRVFRERLLQLDAAHEPEWYWALLANSAHQAYDQGAIQRDIASLPALWRQVAAPTSAGGSGGGWPPPEHR